MKIQTTRVCVNLKEEFLTNLIVHRVIIEEIQLESKHNFLVHNRSSQEKVTSKGNLANGKSRSYDIKSLKTKYQAKQVAFMLSMTRMSAKSANQCVN